MKKLKFILTTAVIASLVSCVTGDDYGTPNLSKECVSITKTKEVSDITSIATATATQYTTGDNVDYIEAYVTSSDEGGNFYKSISMISTDGLTGFSMPVDNYNLYTEFEPGRKVTIKLDKNRYFNKQNGSTVIGSSYNNGVGRISGIEYKNVILRSCQKVNENDIIKNLTIADAKNDKYINSLVEFDAVQFSNTSVGKKYYDPSLNSIGGATNHTITDADGNTIIVRVSEFATFAAKSVPSLNGKIRGVLTKFGSTYQFMIRTELDVQLTGDRFDPTAPIAPTAPTNLLFLGADFENWATFNSSINSFGLKPYAVQGAGAGAVTGNSLHLNGTPTANDYVFTISASAHGTIPANPKKITFWIKGTSAKSLSINVYRSTTGYDVFNLGSISSAAPVSLSKAALQTGSPYNGTNAYTGTIDTGGQWAKITLNISDVQINTSTTGDLFALKVGSNSLYNLHIDNIEIQ
ncbi:DUF5689 domain-containing protein [Flavobacterium luminosum]|uniref:DUF5689 domain-containing protein n=1 Tax=Flavobacterium luminosum TaxID=2949086 RepID=A0ABT0TN38_9FLAO|nr:DUF5689 domain-containing protein [Flavobacterium sp. HXWNR70]MCL9808303.1 DUF5689 domain-containing protein [Flavobacterium sp. HXWNR70]